MKITKIECIPVTSPYKKPFVMSGDIAWGTRSVIVKLHTDEGIVGVGDSGGAEEWIMISSDPKPSLVRTPLT